MKHTLSTREKLHKLVVALQCGYITIAKTCTLLFIPKSDLWFAMSQAYIEEKQGLVSL